MFDSGRLIIGASPIRRDGSGTVPVWSRCSGAVMGERPYPHRRDDCDSCREFDADLAARYTDRAGHVVRWCQRCAGPLLARLVLTGHVVTVTAADLPDGEQLANPQRVVEGGVEVGGVVWTVDLAEQVLRAALPAGSVFLRALIDEGGTATAERLKHLTGSSTLHSMTLTLNVAARKATGGRQASGLRKLVTSHPDPENPRRPVVHHYEFPVELVDIFDTALRRLGR